MASAPFDQPFTVERHGHEVTVDLSELKMLDESAVQEIREPLLRLAREDCAAHLCLDLKGIEYITSSMLETLIQMHRKLKDGGGRLILRNLQPQVRDVFEVTKLDELFEIHKENG
jgi:anti-sigma B factor antagonist